MSNKRINIRIHSRSSALLAHLGALLAVTAWGAAFINTKIIMQNGLSAVEVYFYRFLIAYVCILLICPKPLFANKIGDELKLLLCGVCGNSIYFIAENTALNYTLTTNVSLIVTTAPLLMAMIVGVMYRSERPGRGFIIGSVIAFFGVACVIFNSSFVVKMNPLGDMLALLAAICWAVYSILLRPLSATYSAWFISRKTFFYGLITALPFLALEPNLVGLDVVLRPAVIGNLAFLAIVCSLLSYTCWASANKRLGVMKAGNYLYVSPIVTLIASYFFLGEQISAIGVIGCIMILVGMALSEKLSANQKI